MTTAMMLEITRRQNRGLFERLASRVSDSLRRRAAREQLLNLGDRMLADIGLTRHSVHSDLF